MKRILFLSAMLFAGCQSADQQRVRDLNLEGVHLFRQGDVRGARENFEYALSLSPGDPDLLYNVGQCCERTGDAVRADEFYQRCLQRQPDHADARFALASLSWKNGRRRETTRTIEQWLAQKPELAAPYALDGWRLRQEGNLPAAQKRLQQALDKDSRNLRALTELGLLYESLNLPDRALVLYERVVLIDPHQADVKERLQALRGKNTPRPLLDQ